MNGPVDSLSGVDSLLASECSMADRRLALVDSRRDELVTSSFMVVQTLAARSSDGAGPTNAI